jgi:hypothetical protein
MICRHTKVRSPNSDDKIIYFIRPTLSRLHVCRSCASFFQILQNKTEIAKAVGPYILRSISVATHF